MGISAPRLAVVCPVYNEELLLPQFLAHYSNQVDAIFLLDNESNDRTAAIASTYPNVVRTVFATQGQYKERLQMNARMKKRSECVGRFDYVVMVDADEFILPKRGGTLKEAIATLPPAEYFGTHGYNMFKHRSEMAYDPEAPLVLQRRWGVEDIHYYSKPAIIRPESPATFCVGLHYFLDRDNIPLKPPSPTEFYLLHFTGIEEDLYVQRAMDRTTRLSADNINYQWGFQYQNATPDIYRARFREAAVSERAIQIPLAPPVPAWRPLPLM